MRSHEVFTVLAAGSAIVIGAAALLHNGDGGIPELPQGFELDLDHELEQGEYGEWNYWAGQPSSVLVPLLEDVQLALLDQNGLGATDESVIACDESEVTTYHIATPGSFVVRASETDILIDQQSNDSPTHISSMMIPFSEAIPSVSLNDSEVMGMGGPKYIDAEAYVTSTDRVLEIRYDSDIEGQNLDTITYMDTQPTSDGEYRFAQEY